MRSRKASAVALLASATIVLGANIAAAATSEPPQVTATSDGWTVQPSFTVGESIGALAPPGILDGIGTATALDDETIRVYVNNELEAGDGYPYQLANGVELTGARVIQYDIDKATLTVDAASMAYDAIHDRTGALVEDPTQLSQVVDEEGTVAYGLARFCSARGVEAGYLGFVDAINLQGEEIEDGTQYASTSHLASSGPSRPWDARPGDGVHRRVATRAQAQLTARFGWSARWPASRRGPPRASRRSRRSVSLTFENLRCSAAHHVGSPRGRSSTGSTP